MESGKQFRKRNAILSCLRGTKVHPSADEVHRLLQQEHPDISLATVYRNLSLFKQQGLIRSLGTVEGVERFDGDLHPHSHFVCTGCRRVEDLAEVPIPANLRSQAEQAGCRITGCQLTLTGLCSSCQKSEQEETA